MTLGLGVPAKAVDPGTMPRFGRAVEGGAELCEDTA